MLLKIFFEQLKAYFLQELEPESELELELEPVKKIPGAGQKRTGSATLDMSREIQLNMGFSNI